jgi:hypothetical protein
MEGERECTHYRILVEKPLEKCPFARPRDRWGLTYNIDFNEDLLGG